MGQDGPGGEGPGLPHQVVVAGQAPLERRRVLPDEQGCAAGVGSAVPDLAGRVTRRLQFVPVRHREVVSEGMPAGRGRGRVTLHQQPQHAEPVRWGRELAPVEALPGHERVDRDAETAAHPGQRLAVPGGNRRHHERGAAGPQIHGRRQRRAQPREPRVQGLVLRQPLVLQLIGGHEPPGARRVGHLPVVTAPADGPVRHGRDGQAPPAGQRRHQDGLRQAIRRGQHPATLTADRQMGHRITAVARQAPGGPHP